MEQPSNVNVTPVDRAFLQGQGLLKGMGSQIKKRKMQKKPVQKKPVNVSKAAKPKGGLIDKYEQKAPKGFVRGEMGGLYKPSDMAKHKNEMSKSLQQMKNDLSKKAKK